MNIDSREGPSFPVRQDFARVHDQLDQFALGHLEVYLRLRGTSRFMEDATQLGYEVPRLELTSDEANSGTIAWAGYEFDRPMVRIPSLDLEAFLTPSEFEIMSNLARARGSVLDREELGAGTTAEGRALDVQVRRLRVKLEPHNNLIKTERGFGYRLVRAEPEAKPS